MALSEGDVIRVCHNLCRVDELQHDNHGGTAVVYGEFGGVTQQIVVEQSYAENHKVDNDA